MLLLVALGLVGPSGCGRASITFALGAADERLYETTVIDDGGEAKIALIDVRGLIVDDRKSGFLSSGSNPVDDLVASLEKAAKDPQVRAVVLRINSPGGGVAASETMYAEVRRFRERTGKPVVSAMGEVAASGGYYLALAGDEVMAQPSTITGSIGVIIPTINVSAGMNRIGIVARSVKSGANKDLANPLEPMREDQYAVLQHMVDQFYAEFRGLVLARRGPRGFDESRADELLDGRVFTGSEAAALKLVDRTGGLREAYERARGLAGLEQARLIKYHGEGERPRSAYAQTSLASAEAPHSPPVGGVEMNLLQINGVDGLLGLTSGMGVRPYYLWAPSLP